MFPSVGKVCVHLFIHKEYLGSEDSDEPVTPSRVVYSSNIKSESFSFAWSRVRIYGHILLFPLLQKRAGRRTMMLVLRCLEETLHAWHLSAPGI